VPSLTTQFAGLELRSPIIAGSAAITKDLAIMKRAEDCGAGAVIMKGFSDVEAMRISPAPRYRIIDHKLAHRDAFTFYSYEQASSRTAHEYADEVARTRDALEIPVIVNIDCQEIDSWLENTAIIAAARPDAIEMNVSCPHGSIAFSGNDVENRIVAVVEAVRAQTDIPLIVKLTPQLTSPLNMVLRMQQTGVEAVTLFNRFTGIDVDVDEQRPVMHGGFAGHGGPWARNFVLRWITAVSPETTLGISASGGVAEGEHVAAYLLAGANTVQVCTGVYLEGYDILRRLNAQLLEYLDQHDVASPDELRGLLPSRVVALQDVDRSHTMVAEIQPRGTAPCRWECPINEDVQGYVNLISEQRYDHALALIKQNHPFPGVLGRCCHHPCETKCTRTDVDDPLAISALKRFAADHGGRYLDSTPVPEPPQPERVAVVGAGPAGLTAAYRLALRGYQSTVFEKLPIAGGMLSVGIPEYRLPKQVVNEEIDAITSLGVEIRTNMAIGRDFTIDELRDQGYSAILLAIGGHKQRKLGVPGEDLEGVHEGVTFLRAHGLGELVQLGKRVAVIGGGDVAVDASRVAIRLTDEATMIYRRRREDMPARADEVDEAVEEGVGVIGQLQPVEIIGEGGRVTGIRCVATRPTEPGPDGRVGFETAPGSEQIIECDTVVIAIGQLPDIEWMEAMGLAHMIDCDVICADENTCATCELDIFAAGDAATGAAPLVNAIAAGKRAAASIAAYLRGEDLPTATGPTLAPAKPEDVIEAAAPVVLTRRQRMPRRAAEERAKDFAEVDLGLPEQLALAEAGRCMDCGICSNCGDCVRTCPWMAITRVDDVTQVDPDKCDSCGLCVLICQQQAVGIVARPQ